MNLFSVHWKDFLFYHLLGSEPVIIDFFGKVGGGFGLVHTDMQS